MVRVPNALKNLSFKLFVVSKDFVCQKSINFGFSHSVFITAQFWWMGVKNSFRKSVPFRWCMLICLLAYYLIFFFFFVEPDSILRLKLYLALFLLITIPVRCSFRNFNFREIYFPWGIQGLDSNASSKSVGCYISVFVPIDPI